MQRYFGGNPERWHEMPAWLFWVYVRQRPRLEAEDRLNDLALLQMGSGHVKQQDYEAYTKQLHLAINEGRSPGAAARPASLEAIAAMGGTKVVVE